MNEDDERGKTNPIIHIPIQEHLPPPLSTHIRRHILKLPSRTLPLHLHRLLRNLITKQPTRIPPSPQHQFRIRLFRIHNRLLHLDMYGRFNRTHKPRPHIYTLRP